MNNWHLAIILLKRTKGGSYEKYKERRCKVFKKWKKEKIIGIIFGILLLSLIILLLWFFNRKFDITFDLNNGVKEEIIQVKYNHTIDVKDIKDEKELGESFINWYEVIEIKENEEVLAEESFDFNTKIKKNIKLKAIYKGKIESITITLDSKGGSAVKPQ